MEPKIVIVNGYPGAGKDSFVDLCIDAAKECHAVKVSSVDKVKEAAKLLGWGGWKNDKARQFLSELKDLSTRYYEGPYGYMLSRFMKAKAEADAEGKRLIAFFMIREPVEIQKFKQHMCEYGEVVKLVIDRNTTAASLSNHADRDVHDIAYDIIVLNNWSLKELRLKALTFLSELTAVRRS